MADVAEQIHHMGNKERRAMSHNISRPVGKEEIPGFQKKTNSLVASLLQFCVLCCGIAAEF